MKLRLLVPAIVATATALGASGGAHSEALDGQAQAAALLSRPDIAGPVKAQESRYAAPSSAAMDAHATAAALLGGRTSAPQANASVRVAGSAVSTPLDAHAQAAALLTGSHVTVGESSQSTHRSERLGEHPAVLVAQTWSMRGIDPNTFIVAHPARLQLLAASPTESQPQSVESVADVRAARLSRTLAK